VRSLLAVSYAKLLWAVLLVGAMQLGLAEEARTSPLRVGVDANYSLDMESGGSTWMWEGKPRDLFDGIKAQGVSEFRVRLWTKEDGPHGKAYATDVVKRALRSGLNPYLVIFLSEDWSDMMKQPIPTAWKDLSFEERLVAVRDYSRDVVTHFRKEGLHNHLYEIGNEIDYGICGEYPGKSTKKNPESLSRNLWPRSAEIIRASQAGVLEADPEAKFLLHIAHWWDLDFCVAFFRFMVEHGVQLDYAGLSYFPSSNIGGSLDLEQFGTTITRLNEALDRPIIIPETAYPSTREFSGQFSRWKYEVMGYPMTPEGQQRWLADFLAYCHQHPAVHAVYYWSPEWFGEGMWKGFALFDPKGEAKPAWASFAGPAWENRAVKEAVFVEVQSNRLHVVPVQEAKAQMLPLISRLRQQTGGVTVEHIALLTNTDLRVGGYAVNLKGSLQQNLNLDLVEPGSGFSLGGEDADASWKSVVAQLDPLRQKLVLILRQEVTPELRQAIHNFEQTGLQVALHPKVERLSLKFGMSGELAQWEAHQAVSAPDRLTPRSN
jgi:arabinogalactan endo-1,4-beta-galactosidase